MRCSLEESDGDLSGSGGLPGDIQGGSSRDDLTVAWDRDRIKVGGLRSDVAGEGQKTSGEVGGAHLEQVRCFLW